MTQRLRAQGDEGPFFYDDDKEYPAEIYNNTPFVRQVSYLGEGATGLLSREDNFGQAYGYLKEILASGTISNGGNIRFNDRIQTVPWCMLRIGSTSGDAFCMALIQSVDIKTNISNAVDILHDPRNNFGLGTGTSDFNFYLDGSDELRLENNSGSDNALFFLEESAHFVGNFAEVL